MAQLIVRSVLWRNEGISVDLEISNVSKLPMDKQTYPEAVLPEEVVLFPVIGGSWHASAELLPSRADEDDEEDGRFFLQVWSDSTEDRSEAVSVMVEAVRETWIHPRSGRVFKKGVGIIESVFAVKIALKTFKQIGCLCIDTLRLRISICGQPPQANPKGPLSHFGSILDSGDLSDMIIASDGREFQVHRSILAARSPVLKNMISSSMQETIHRRVEATDTDATTMAAFLQFLYTGSCDFSGFEGAKVTGQWYVIESSVSEQCEYGLTYTLDEIHSNDSCFLRHQGECVIVTYGDCDGDLDSEQVMKPVSPGHWEADGRNGGGTLLVTNGRVVIRRRRLSWADRHLYLHCREWEIQFAKFWGRLLCAADKYCVDDLTSYCTERVLPRLSVWSAATMLHFASLTSQTQLKRDIVDFITLGPEFFQNVRDMPEFESLDRNLQDEVTEAFVHRLRTRERKRKAFGEASKEFADGQDWQRLSSAQLRRACAERRLAMGGGHDALVALLRAHEQENA